MNDAINAYKGKWFPEEKLTDPCVAELEARKDDEDKSDHPQDSNTTSQESGAKDNEAKVLVLCEDYGQSIALPSYKASRPNVNYFHSDLHLLNFNVCNTTINKNSIYLCNEGSRQRWEYCIYLFIYLFS